MYGDGTSGLIFLTPSRLAEACRKAMERYELSAEDVDLLGDNPQGMTPLQLRKGMTLLQLRKENAKMLSLLRSLTSLASFACKYGENSDECRVCVTNDFSPVSLLWHEEKLIGGEWKSGIAGGLIWHSASQEFSVHT